MLVKNGNEGMNANETFSCPHDVANVGFSVGTPAAIRQKKVLPRCVYWRHFRSACHVPRFSIPVTSLNAIAVLTDKARVNVQ